MTVFQNRGMGKKKMAFGAPYPGKIIPAHLAEIGGELIAQKDSFLCAAKGVSVGIAFNKRIGVGLFGGEGFIMQRLQGDGLAFVHAGGTLMERTLAPGEVLRVDTGCIVASSPAWITTFSSWAASRARSSAARVCSSPRCAARARSGCSRCRSAGGDQSSRPPCPRPPLPPPPPPPPPPLNSLNPTLPPPRKRGCWANRQGFGRRARRHAAWSAVAARYRVRPPCRCTSRLMVDVGRCSRRPDGREAVGHPHAKSSSRSAAVSVRRARRRGAAGCPTRESRYGSFDTPSAA